MAPQSARPKNPGLEHKPGSFSPRAGIALAAGGIVLAALAAYHNSFSGPFVLDDLVTTVNNPSIRHLWPLGPVFSPPPTTFSGGRPILNLSFAVNFAMGGLSVQGYHVVNLIIHALAGLVLFGVVHRTLTMRTGESPQRLVFAFGVALLWTVHPLNTESVTYIYERAESLMGLFYLLTLYCFIRFSGGDSSAVRSSFVPHGGTSADSGAGRRLWGWLSIIACALGMATKQVMITAPVIVFLYDRTFVSGTFRKAWLGHWRYYLGLMLSWVLFAYEWSGGRAHDYQVGYGTGVTWWTYGLTECRVVVNYIRLAFWPHPQVVDFGLTVLNTSVGEVALYALVLLVLVALTAVALRFRPVLGFLGCWYFVILSPTSSVVPIAGQSAGEHHMYLPLIALIALVAAFLCSWLGARSLYVFLALGVLLGWRTVRRNEDYRSVTAFYQAIVEQRPDNYFARCNLAKALAEDGKVDEATSQFQEAVRLGPDDAMPRLGLGDALAGQGRLEEAVAQYEAGVRIDPRSGEARCGLGNALFREGRLAEAVSQYREAVKIDPDNGGVYYNLGLAQSQLGSLGEAIESYRQALRVGGDVPGVHANLGAVLARSGRFPEAAADLRAALQLDPNDANARRNYELVLRRLGR